MLTDAQKSALPASVLEILENDTWECRGCGRPERRPIDVELEWCGTDHCNSKMLRLPRDKEKDALIKLLAGEIVKSERYRVALEEIRDGDQGDKESLVDWAQCIAAAALEVPNAD